MKIWRCSWDSFFLGFSSSFFFLFFLFVLFKSVSGLSYFGVVSSCFVFDSISVYLVFLNLVIFLCICFFSSWLDRVVLYFVFFSQVFSVFCYVCCHALFFWVFYELSIVMLLYLILKDSPYSERYTAFWYFCGYLIFSGLPMLMVLLYFSYVYGSFSFYFWDFWSEDWLGLFVLSILFMTKIPLFPFQVWLPIVHAESSSVVSVCLSGYIMKLGILGLFRFCFFVVGDYIFFIYHLGFIVFLSVVFFVCCSFELDGKRWLAFLSLSHIGVVPLCLGSSGLNGYLNGFCYCLGHGISSALTFILLWVMSSVCGSRNWLILKCVVPSSFWIGFFSLAAFCFCASFPPSLQFFSEMKIFCDLLHYSSFVFCWCCFYLFFSGLVPLLCFGCFFSRCGGIRFSCSGFVGLLIVILFLFVLNVFCFMFF